MVPELFRGPVVEGAWAPENGSTSSFFSIRSGPGGVLSRGSGEPSEDQLRINQHSHLFSLLSRNEQRETEKKRETSNDKRNTKYEKRDTRHEIRNTRNEKRKTRNDNRQTKNEQRVKKQLMINEKL